MPGRGKLDLSAASELVMRGGLSILKLTSSSRVGAVYTWVVIVAGFFVLVALAVSTFLIFEHLSWYNNPEEQKWLIGVILIVPLYATESFLSLCSSHFALEWEILRDCYEAFALYSFGRYLIACLGGEDRTIEMMERQAIAGPRTPLLDHSSGKAVVKHLFPLNYFLKPWSLGQEFYQAFKFGIVQYMGFAATSYVYVFPAKPYQLMGQQKRGSVSVLADYASIDSPLDPEEVKDSERPSFTRFYHPDVPEIGTSLKDSMHDVVFKGGQYIVNDVKFTVDKVREPVEKGISRLNETIHQLKRNIKSHEKGRRQYTKDDSWLSSSPKSYSSIRGIDDPLLTGSISDSGVGRGTKRKSSLTYGSAESSSESSDQGFGSIRTSGHRWTVKD
eukprot:c28152_g1_i3 orf=571-1734(+)